MRKFIVCLMLILAAAVSMSASDRTGRAATMAREIKSYLAKEGYMANVDSEGDIKFKSEGDTYYISIRNYDDGCYIDVYTLENLEGLSINAVRRAADETQTSYKFVRMDVLSDTLMSIGVVGYYGSINDFKIMFGNILDIIHTCEKKFIEKYSD